MSSFLRRFSHSCCSRGGGGCSGGIIVAVVVLLGGGDGVFLVFMRELCGQWKGVDRGSGFLD